CQHSYGLPYSF
nr:immunoglobulin light chain junction region [Macaca mulatta]